MAQRGVRVSYETIRQWCLKFGETIAAELRRRRPRPGDMWHLDEVYLKINGRTHYLWRAVDQQGVVLDILVQGRRNKQAAKRFLGRLLTGMQYAPRNHSDLQTQELWRRHKRAESRSRTSPAQGPQQSGRELPPADSRAGTKNAAVHSSRRSRPNASW